MPPDITFCEPVHTAHLLENLHELQKLGMFCDVTLMVNKKEIKVHKAVLAAISPYFRIMFNSAMKEAKEDKIVLRDIEFNILTDIINFIYTSKIKVSEDNVYCLMEAADLFQLSAIRTVCCHYLSSTLNSSNCLSVYVRAKLRRYHDLAHLAFRYALQNFDKVINEEEFLHAPADVLFSILSSQLLHVDDEGVLLQGLVRWLKYDEASREDHQDSLISKLNLNLVPMPVLVSCKTDPLLSNSKFLSRVDKAITDILSERYDSGDIKKLYSYSRKTHWKHRYGAEQEVILALGGESNGMALGSVECFTLGYDTWRCIVPSLIQENGEFVDTRVIPTMQHPRLYPAVATRDYEVFVAGGYNLSSLLNSVEYYSIQSHVWTTLTPLPVSLQGAGAEFVDGCLYIVGGAGQTGYEKRVWIYEENQNCWQEATPMTTHRGFHGVACVLGILFALGGSGKTFDMGWMSVPRSNFGITVSFRRIYCLGGHDGIHYLNTVEKYNPHTNRWHCVNAMQVRRFGVTAGTVHVPVIKEEPI
uniref:BTB domain-containing protein n=1 Tax=Timema bartmani TaxID=61472 RepID=A0A7R9ESK8_9NEOP|nr:unnamed protein product [Timema bartmani]